MIFDLFRKENSITTSQQLADYLSVGLETIAGVAVTGAAALKFGPVFSCVRVLAESIGQLPLHLYESSDGITREKAISNPLYGILHAAPNDYMTSQEWREMMVAHLCLRGNHYSYVNRVRGTIRELLPLNPDAVEVTQDENFEIHYRVKFPDGSEDVLSHDKILHIKLMTIDGFKGLSPISQAREVIGHGIATQQYGSRLFKNGARPGGILSTEGTLKKDQIDAIREQWESVHGGSENAHKAAILQGGLTWTAVAMSAEDAQFLETRKFNRAEIAGIFRVPPHMIGDLERATFSNIEQQSIDFVVYTLMPWITKIEQRISLNLLTRQERAKFFAKVNVAGLLRGDMKTRAEFYTRMVQIGVISPNEVRESEDMNPREGGDIYLTPTNMAIDGKPVGNDKGNNYGTQAA